MYANLLLFTVKQKTPILVHPAYIGTDCSLKCVRHTIFVQQARIIIHRNIIYGLPGRIIIDRDIIYWPTWLGFYKLNGPPFINQVNQRAGYQELWTLSGIANISNHATNKETAKMNFALPAKNKVWLHQTRGKNFRAIPHEAYQNTTRQTSTGVTFIRTQRYAKTPEQPRDFTKSLTVHPAFSQSRSPTSCHISCYVQGDYRRLHYGYNTPHTNHQATCCHQGFSHTNADIHWNMWS